ncbi:MAG TPA: hypothetical protein VFR80_04405, partial [Pyrinomonadaceae bacterium]|nr:hypothetical protein [Pyrinomonadaceae bacterium]
PIGGQIAIALWSNALPTKLVLATGWKIGVHLSNARKPRSWSGKLELSVGSDLRHDRDAFEFGEFAIESCNTGCAAVMIAASAKLNSVPD